MESSYGAGSSSDWVSSTARRVAELDVTESRTSGSKRWRVADAAAAEGMSTGTLFGPSRPSQRPPASVVAPAAPADPASVRRLAVEACEYARKVLAAKPLTFEATTGLRVIEGRPLQAMQHRCFFCRRVPRCATRQGGRDGQPGQEGLSLFPGFSVSTHVGADVGSEPNA